MNESNVSIEVRFTAPLLSAEPALTHWQFHGSFRAIGPHLPAALWLQVGDTARIEGIPVPYALAVVGRSWELMSDESRLTLFLGLPDGG